MIIIDVRTKEEFEESHVKNAVNISAEHFMRPHLPDELKHASKEEHIVLYCRTGNRASAVQSSLHRHGFTHVENYINQIQTENRIKN